MAVWNDCKEKLSDIRKEMEYYIKLQSRVQIVEWLINTLKFLLFTESNNSIDGVWGKVINFKYLMLFSFSFYCSFKVSQTWQHFIGMWSLADKINVYPVLLYWRKSKICVWMLTHTHIRSPHSLWIHVL